MNANQIYQSLIDLDKVKTTVEDKVTAEKAREGVLLAWRTWRQQPIGQEFITILSMHKKKCIDIAKHNPKADNSLLLCRVGFIDEILERVLVDGTFNT